MNKLYLAYMKYKGILLKLSGEALAGSELGSIKQETVDFIAEEVREAHQLGVKIAVVIGGGNIYRGNRATEDGVREETAHYMGMLATCINALALSDLLQDRGLPNVTLSALGSVGKMSSYSIEAGRKVLSQGKVLILAGGIGKPFNSSDAATAVRAKELGLDIIFKATKVDGVYDSDPVINPEAKKFESLTFREALDKDLKVIDRSVFEFCRENDLTLVIFKIENGNIKKAILGEKIGTIIQNKKGAR